MKKHFVRGMLAIALAFGLTLAGCMTARPTDAGRYDSSSPESNDSILVIAAGTMITEFDGQKVSWLANEGSLLTMFSDPPTFIIRVPAGSHTLTGGPAATQQGGRALQYSTSTKFTFAAKKTYNIAVVSRNFKITEAAN